MAKIHLHLRELARQRRMARIARVVCVDGLAALADDDFLWLQNELDGEYLRRFPLLSDTEDLNHDHPF